MKRLCVFLLALVAMLALIGAVSAQCPSYAPAYAPSYAPAYCPPSYSNNYDGNYHWFAATSYSPAGYYRWAAGAWYHQIYGYAYRSYYCPPAPPVVVQAPPQIVVQPAPQIITVQQQPPQMVAKSYVQTAPQAEVLPKPSTLTDEEAAALKLLLKKLGQ